jgi:hypothetical protein
MKILILFLGIITAIPAICQTPQPELVEVIRRWPNRIDINVTNGMVHKRVVSDQSDSAFYYHANGKKYLATTTFTEIGGVVVPPVTTPIKIEAETATTINGAFKEGITICCIQAGASLRYTSMDLGARLKVKIRYSRGNPGNANLTLKVGSNSFLLSFEGTGGWSTWREKEFDITGGNGLIEITSATAGPVNLDWIEFR